jgi:hypothetical protein
MFVAGALIEPAALAFTVEKSKRQAKRQWLGIAAHESLRFVTLQGDNECLIDLEDDIGAS